MVQIDVFYTWEGVWSWKRALIWKPGDHSPFTRDLLCDPLWSQLSPLGRFQELSQLFISLETPRLKMTLGHSSCYSRVGGNPLAPFCSYAWPVPSIELGKWNPRWGEIHGEQALWETGGRAQTELPTSAAGRDTSRSEGTSYARPASRSYGGLGQSQV